jgi:hypothetical protein
VVMAIVAKVVVRTTMMAVINVVVVVVVIVHDGPRCCECWCSWDVNDDGRCGW